MRAEQSAGRTRGSTQLIAVSKLQPDERVRAVLEQGYRLFGENRVPEAAGQWPRWREACAKVGRASGRERVGKAV